MAANSRHGEVHPSALPASIEVSPSQAISSVHLPGLFPKGTYVYVTDMGETSNADWVSATSRLSSLGYNPVVHIAARRLQSTNDFVQRLSAITRDGVTQDALIIGGGVATPAGEFASSMDVLESGLLDKYGIKNIAVAGHPEGSPDFSDDIANQALVLKQKFMDRSDAKLRIVTQFGFDGAKFADWAEALSQSGIDMPVHMGVAGPAKLPTLIKYAAMCGVGNSLSFLTKRASSVLQLATGFSPEVVVKPIEDHVAAVPNSAIVQLHVYPFGGLQGAAEWLADRGSWSVDQLNQSANKVV